MMVLHGADPVFLGMRGTNNDMKLAMMVTLHWRERGQCPVVSEGVRLKEGSDNGRQTSVGGVALTTTAITVCLVAGYTIYEG